MRRCRVKRSIAIRSTVLWTMRRKSKSIARETMIQLVCRFSTISRSTYPSTWRVKAPLRQHSPPALRQIRTTSPKSKSRTKYRKWWVRSFSYRSTQSSAWKTTVQRTVQPKCRLLLTTLLRNTLNSSTKRKLRNFGRSSSHALMTSIARCIAWANKAPYSWPS